MLQNEVQPRSDAEPALGRCGEPRLGVGFGVGVPGLGFKGFRGLPECKDYVRFGGLGVQTLSV